MLELHCINLDWDSLAYWLTAIATGFLAVAAWQAKSEWEKQRKLTVFQELFGALAHAINWLNNFYDFASDPESYHGQKSQEKEYINKKYHDKKKFIIEGCLNAINKFLKVNIAMQRFFIFEETGNKLKEYYEELNKILYELKNEDPKTGKLIKPNPYKKSP